MPSGGFDYVVVGRGTAGVTIRLSEDKRVRVGLLEAGGYVTPREEPRIDLIVTYGPVLLGLKFDWNSKSVLQEGLDGRVVQETVSHFLSFLPFFPLPFFSLLLWGETDP
jgi:choline dehydrogenase-like flavoprotein